MHCPFEALLVCVRWYAAYPRSFRHIEERMVERGVFVDHSTVHRRALKIPPVLALVFRRRKRPVVRAKREYAGACRSLERAPARVGL